MLFVLFDEHNVPEFQVFVNRFDDSGEKGETEYSVDDEFPEMLDFDGEREVDVPEADSGESDQPEIEGVDPVPMVHLVWPDK